ncbi:MAG: S9 family peptidase [Pseudomonadota bacterium]
MQHLPRRACAALAGLLLALGTALAQPAGPLAPKQARDVSVHGDPRSDDYFWMRQRDDPRLLPHLQAENTHADAWLAPHRPLQKTLYDEMLGRLQQDDEAVPYREGRWWYSTRTREGAAYPIHIRRPAVGPERRFDPAAPEQVLFDLNRMAEGQAYLSMPLRVLSPDGRRAAYATDLTGGRDNLLQVRDIASGRDLDWRLPEVSSAAWAADSRTLFYVTMDAAKRSHRLWRAVPGSAQAPVLVHEEPDAQFDIQVRSTRDQRWLVLETGSKDESDSRVLDARRPTGAWRSVLPRRPGVLYDLDHRAGLFYLRINDTGPDFRLVTVEARAPQRAAPRELIAAAPGLMLEQVDLFRHHLVVTERRGGLHALRVRDLRRSGPAAEHLVQFDEPAYLVQGLQNAEFDTRSFRFSYQSMVTPQTVYDYGLDDRQRQLRKRQPVLGGYEPARYASERLSARAADGTAVPISLVYRRDLRRGGPQPLLLYGYGSYGAPSDPNFNPSRLALLDRGVVFAIAHIRGGGELGRSWYQAGKMAHKQNTFGDFIASAEALIAQGYTSPAQLAILGGSAGGLLMGAVVNQRPELFHAVVAEVPFVDVVNTMLDETIPLTTAEFQEWGNPKLPEQYRWIRAYSPYDNLKPGAYPAMLVRTGLNDSQVPYWEPAKYVARLRALKTDARPLLLKVNLQVGHGGASGRFDALQERAEAYAFLLAQWGISR